MTTPLNDPPTPGGSPAARDRITDDTDRSQSDVVADAARTGADVDTERPEPPWDEVPATRGEVARDSDGVPVGSADAEADRLRSTEDRDAG